MHTLNLDDKEIKLLRKSIEHCMETCHSGGPHHGCENCEALEGILQKL